MKWILKKLQRLLRRMELSNRRNNEYRGVHGVSRRIYWRLVVLQEEHRRDERPRVAQMKFDREQAGLKRRANDR